MSFKKSFFISLILVSCFFIQFASSIEIKLETKKGNYENLILNFTNNSNGQNKNKSQVNSIEGKISEEIILIQNKIKYPLYALEEKIESNCEWMIEVGENKKAVNIKNIKPCTHKSFEDEFLNVIKTWEFQLPSGISINIPIKFKLAKND